MTLKHIHTKKRGIGEELAIEACGLPEKQEWQPAAILQRSATWTKTGQSKKRTQPDH